MPFVGKVVTAKNIEAVMCPSYNWSAEEAVEIAAAIEEAESRLSVSRARMRASMAKLGASRAKGGRPSLVT